MMTEGATNMEKAPSATMPTIGTEAPGPSGLKDAAMVADKAAATTLVEPKPETAEKSEKSDAVVKETLAEKLQAGEVAAKPAATGETKPAEAKPVEADKSPVFYQFVVFPLIIVALAVAITGFFTWLARDERSYDEYLHEISNGWKMKRSEAAYQLQFRLADERDPLRKTADAKKTIDVFLAAKKDRAEDPRVRRYLAVVLGQLATPEAVDPLIEAVSLDEPDQETRLNATWALARVRDPRAVSTLVSLLEDSFEGQRKIACFALGDIGEKAYWEKRDPKAFDQIVKLAAEPLFKHLRDEKLDVRWNAALALARLGDERALPTLLSMLDRRHLDSISGLSDDDHVPMTDKQREDVMINALRGIYALKASSALVTVSGVADTDRSTRVRQAAMDVRDFLKGQLPR